MEPTEATVAFDATGDGALAMDILTTFDTSLRQLYPGHVHTSHQEQVQQRVVEQIVHVSVPSVADEIVEVLQKRICECIAEQMVFVPVPPNAETVEVLLWAPEERVRQRTIEQIVDVPVTMHLEAAPSQCTHRIMDLSVVLHRQAPINETAKKANEVPQSQFF